MRKLLAVALLLAAGAGSPAQTVTLPKEKAAPVNAWTVIHADADGGPVKWMLPDAGVQEVLLTDLFPPATADLATGRIFYASQPGRYRIWAVCAKGDKVSERAECVFVVGEAPPVPPGPGPVPPGPGPGPDPDPFEAAAGAGLKVLVVTESSDLSKLPRSQVTILTSSAVRAYLASHSAKEGNTPTYRFWDQNVDVSNETALWQKVWKAPRKSLPWIYIGDGKRGFSGPLPADVASTLALLQRYGGN
jgi:hypothetical protein